MSAAIMFSVEALRQKGVKLGLVANSPVVLHDGNNAFPV